MSVRPCSPRHRAFGPAARRMLGCALLLLAAACSASPPEERVADGDEGAPPPAATQPAPAAAAPSPPPDEAGTAAGPTACTQIGCNDGLNVELDGFEEEVELELTAGGETRTVTCLPPGPCRHFIPDFAPAEVTATAFLADGTEEERSFEPEYREERPNGPDCPPVCRQASIRWKL